MLKVACALIVENGKLLCAQRGPNMRHPFAWEFPGGKIEEGETPEACIVREIREELNLEVVVLGNGPAVKHTYSAGLELSLMPFICCLVAGELILREHAQVLWLPSSQLFELDWAAADVGIVKWWQKHAQDWL